MLRLVLRTRMVKRFALALPLLAGASADNLHHVLFSGRVLRVPGATAAYRGALSFVLSLGVLMGLVVLAQRLCIIWFCCFGTAVVFFRCSVDSFQQGVSTYSSGSPTTAPATDSDGGNYVCIYVYCIIIDLV